MPHKATIKIEIRSTVVCRAVSPSLLLEDMGIEFAELKRRGKTGSAKREPGTKKLKELSCLSYLPFEWLPEPARDRAAAFAVTGFLLDKLLELTPAPR